MSGVDRVRLQKHLLCALQCLTSPIEVCQIDPGSGKDNGRVGLGVEIGRPGLVDVEVERDDEEFVSVRSGGPAVVSLKGKLQVPR